MCNKPISIIFILTIFLISCSKDAEIPNNKTSFLNINYNDNQVFQIKNIPDSCLIYDTIKHVVYATTCYNSIYDKVEMSIFINLDSISYPFLFPKKNIISENYYDYSPLTQSQCAVITFFKIVPPDTSLVSNFTMISADIKSELNLTNYSDNYLTGNFHGTLYCYMKSNGEFIPNDGWPLLDSMKINSGEFYFKLRKE